jgi:hypothetical protein
MSYRHDDEAQKAEAIEESRDPLNKTLPYGGFGFLMEFETNRKAEKDQNRDTRDEAEYQ